MTNIFKRLYDDEAYIFGGEPYGLILCDYAISNGGEDAQIMKSLSAVGAAISAPVLLGADPNLFSMDTWEELHRPRELG